MHAIEDESVTINVQMNSLIHSIASFHHHQCGKLLCTSKSSLCFISFSRCPGDGRGPSFNLKPWRRSRRCSPLPPCPPVPTLAPRGSKSRTLPGTCPFSWGTMLTTSRAPRRELRPPPPASTRCTTPTRRTRRRPAPGSRRWCGRRTARAASVDLPRPPPHRPPPAVGPRRPRPRPSRATSSSSTTGSTA